MKTLSTCAALSIASLCALSACSTHRDKDTAPVAATTDGWRESFSVDKSRLASTGTSRYWVLEPGYTSVYKDEDVTLTIRVLGETRVVDGVTTRVIEEREENKKGLIETSRNFFAINPASGDVYYFGEEVDIYKNGKIDNHGGAWASGVGGARFGLGLPGSPKVGDRYYQEVAPGTAMDRGEIVCIDERVTTPAGVYEHCVKVKETTPLEKGVSHKWYAPGVGLVRDDEAVLVSAGKR